MSIFRRKQRSQIVLDGISGSAARAVYQGETSLPHIEFRFETQTKDEISEVVIEMDLESATKFIQSAIAAHEVSVPSLNLTRRPVGG